MKAKRWLDTAVVVLGTLSFLSLFGFFLALHDIWHDSASPEVWARAGQALPPWYSPYNRTPVEWVRRVQKLARGTSEERAWR